MTLEEAIENPGVPVLYTHPSTGRQEEGVLCRVAERRLVYVYYGETLIATHPANLEFDRNRR
jgi:predicted nuclease with RNAse H fold